jgi:hypothetical protein
VGRANLSGQREISENRRACVSNTQYRIDQAGEINPALTLYGDEVKRWSGSPVIHIRDESDAVLLTRQ